MSAPDVSFNVLPNADGSASYAWQGYNIVGSVNGPIEPQRRDELPQEALVEVHVRPANGTGGTRERHIESVVHAVLRSIILTESYPRSLIQVTLQILGKPETGSSPAPAPQSTSHIPLLPHLLHTALLALLAANIPLSKVYTAVLCATDSSETLNGAVRAFPTAGELQRATSIHAFVYATTGETLAIESEGRFDLDVLNRAASVAQLVCIGDTAGEMPEQDEPEPLAVWLRRIVTDRVKTSSKWRGNL